MHMQHSNNIIIYIIDMLFTQVDDNLEEHLATSKNATPYIIECGSANYFVAVYIQWIHSTKNCVL